MKGNRRRPPESNVPPRPDGCAPPRPTYRPDLADRKVVGWTRPAPPPLAGTSRATTVSANASIDATLRVGQQLQGIIDEIERMNARARDRIADWRRGSGTLAPALQALNALKEFVLALPY